MVVSGTTHSKKPESKKNNKKLRNDRIIHSETLIQSQQMNTSGLKHYPSEISHLQTSNTHHNRSDIDYSDYAATISGVSQYEGKVHARDD
jgi:hypothetical protein